MKHAPITSVLFLLGILAILAVPPSALFASELLMVGFGMANQPWLTVAILFGLTLIAVGMLRSTTAMLFGSASEPPAEQPETAPERWNVSHGVIACLLLLLGATGVFVLTDTGRGLASFIALSISSV